MKFIDPKTLRVWVHTWWARTEVMQGTLKSLDASDAAGIYTVEVQGKVDPITFYIETLARMCLEAEWILRFEDDTLVNRHILHNVGAWNVPYSEPDFGIGYLSVPQNVRDDAEHVGRGAVTGCPYRKYPELHFGGCMLFQSSTLHPRLEAIEAGMRGHPHAAWGQYAFACAPSAAMWRDGLEAYFHTPTLVMLDLKAPRNSDGAVLGEAAYGPQSLDFDWKAP